jgi:hypothetical protein
MRLAAIFARAAIAAVIAVPSAIGIALVSSNQASAQFNNLPAMGGGGGGGGRRGGGGGGMEMYDPCEWGDCYRRPPRRIYGPPPRVYVVPENGLPPYVYEEDFGPEAAPRRIKPKVKQAKPKTKEQNQTQGQGQSQAAANRTFRPDEVLVEIPLSVSEADVDALALQQRIEKLGSQEISLLNSRIYRWRITDGRSPETVAAALRTDSRVADAHLNRIFTLQETKAASPAGPPQYAAEKLKLNEVHNLSRGESILVALIDSGADGTHPELDGALANTFDAIGGTYQPHTHGTGMAGAIAAHAQINGVAPKSRILNVRAFASTGKTNDGTTFDVIRGMDWAAQQGARVFNLSFAGPRDPLMARVVKAAIDKGIVVVAAAGNAGPKSPPLYPAAEAGVIAVTATDAKDGLIAAANRGGYITIAAPGADILLPAPDKAYSISSGTSIATAYVSGVVALMIARHPEADSKEIYEVLTGTARDLGTKGRDKEFGAGLADPLAALEAMEPIAQTVSAPADEPPPVR